MSDNTDVVKAIQQMTKEIVQAIRAPRVLVKDGKGRPIAVKPGNIPHHLRTAEDDDMADISHH